MVIPSGTFSIIYNTLVGPAIDERQMELWQLFKHENGYSSDPLDTNVQAIGQFVQFLQASTAGAVTQLSPNELKKRLVMGQVLQAIIKLLAQYGNSVMVQSSLAQNYSGLQEKYTQLMGIVPIYTPNASNAPTISLPDPNNDAGTYQMINNFKLGYDNLSMGDLLYSVANTDTLRHITVPQFRVSTNFSYSGSDIAGYSTGNGPGYFHISPSAAGSGTPTSITIQFRPGPDGTAFRAPPLPPGTPPGTSLLHEFETTISFTSSDPNTRLVQIATAFNHLYRNIAALGFFSITDNTRTFFIPWRDTAYTTDASSRRTVHNQANQQVLTSDRAKRDVIGQQRDAAINRLQSTTSSMQGNSSIITSTIQTLVAIMQSLFKSK